MELKEAIKSRRSVRAFTDRAVPAEWVRDILDHARLSPSGGNLQPWRVHVVTGETRARIIAAALKAHEAGETRNPFPVYPPGLWEPYRTRRRDAGTLRFQALGETGRTAEGTDHMARLNYGFFGAPVGLFIFLESRMEPSQWTDLGLFLQNVMLLCRDRGLSSCPQAVWSTVSHVVRPILGEPEANVLVAGMSVGFADEDNRLAKLQTDRADVDSFTTFHD
ncbi:nitroreductase [Seohaeicola zhoushanensis]|uniref:Nitroreductase n=1 Tax=Seohaeicola zhoushanensis TaxID=1569283 RepID=A0A8J3H2H9_9RHOB|nr:nitroreductase [Seohaeicola zhoushanensis]GHF76340.1 nitroreductase [Seohaeicola zhoushanensis]